jgi:hypothetical protein
VKPGKSFYFPLNSFHSICAFHWKSSSSDFTGKMPVPQAI